VPNEVSYDALLLDMGYVILEVSWPVLEAYEKATGIAMPTSALLEQSDDPLWDARVEGVSESDRYWDGVARAAGFDGFLAMFREMVATVPDAMIDRDAIALINDARAAGKKVGVLSNDAYSFVGREFFEGRPEFADLDAFVDAVDIGVRKPDPAAYLAAADALGVAPETVVFLDDTPECVRGAGAVGMAALQVDPLARRPAFDEARRLLGLSITAVS
jgi:putative hydrolase of the HAD superfamily